MEDDSFYVKITEPVEFRRNILMSSKQLLGVLKQSERISEIRDEKIKNISELRKIIEEIVLLNRKLQAALPKAKSAPTPFKKLSAMTSPRRGDLEALESELGKIEAKLGELSED
jgi:hypothetical protein